MCIHPGRPPKRLPSRNVNEHERIPCLPYLSGGWFGTVFFHILGRIIPTYSYFFRGVGWNHQPVIVLLICSRQPCFDVMRWNQKGTENRHSAESHKRCSFFRCARSKRRRNHAAWLSKCRNGKIPGNWREKIVNLWFKQWFLPPMTGNANHTTCLFDCNKTTEVPSELEGIYRHDIEDGTKKSRWWWLEPLMVNYG